MFKLHELTKVYGKAENLFTALDRITLDIPSGSSVAIVGKSGSGKSTLLHILACLDRPSSGTLEIDSVQTTQLSDNQLNLLRNADFGFVFQQFFLNPYDTVLDNVALPLKIRGYGKAQREALAERALSQVDLLDKAQSRARDLSGGQKQRACIARALVGQPKVIFADEPTGNLDSQTGEQIENLLFDLHHHHGITLIIVTHDPDLAAKCNRQITIKDGSVVDDSTKDSIK